MRSAEVHPEGHPADVKCVPGTTHTADASSSSSSPKQSTPSSDTLPTFDVPAPKFTRALSFADEQDERAYSTELRALYARRLLLSGVLFALFFAVVTAAECTMRFFVANEAVSNNTSCWLGVLAVLVSMGLVALGAAAQNAHSITVASIDVLTTASLVGLAVILAAFAFLAPGTTTLLAQTPPDDAAAPPHTPTTRWVVCRDATAHVVVIPVFAAMFLPLQAVAACTLSAYLVLQQGILAALNLRRALAMARAAPGDALAVHAVRQAVETTAIFVLIVLAMLMGRLSLLVSHRSNFHFERTAARVSSDASSAMRTTQELKSVEAAQRLQLGTSQAGKQARSRLIRMVMHDLRTPLLAVSNVVSMLDELDASTPVGSSEVVELVASMGKMSTLMQHIISDMLDFERIDSGRQVLVPAPFTMPQLIDDASTTFKGLAEAKGVAIHHAPITHELANTPFIADVRRLQQCVNNGLSNALKFTRSGGTVTLSARTEGTRGQLHPRHAANESSSPCARHPAAMPGIRTVVIAIKDNGIGLGADELEQLRKGEPFSQQVGKGQMEGNGGTGLGLSITRQLLQLHDDSTLRIDSAGPGQGTTLELRLNLWLAEPSTPARRCEPPAASSASTVEAGEHSLQPVAVTVAATAALTHPADTAGTARPAKGPKRRPELEGFEFPPSFRCLYVDDDRILHRTFPRRVFERLGAQYDCAWHGAEALQKVVDGPQYDVIVMDNQMPHMSGTVATRKLREAGFSGMIIGMTGDPVGCPERDEFDSAGLDLSVDKDEKGVKGVVRVLESFMQLSAAAPATLDADAAAAEAEARVPDLAPSMSAPKLGGGRAKRRSQSLPGGEGLAAPSTAAGEDEGPDERRQRVAAALARQVRRPSQSASGYRRRHRVRTLDAVALQDYHGEDDNVRVRPRTTSMFFLPDDAPSDDGGSSHSSSPPASPVPSAHRHQHRIAPHS